MNTLSKFGNSLLHWTWTKSLLYWLILSAGTMSECVFLIASLWISLNSSVHQFVLLFLSENTTIHLTELATAAYVALPECILGLAFVTTISHIRIFTYDRQDKAAAMWSILYGAPTLVFLVLSAITLGCSVTSTDFRLPEYLVVIRALAGYMYAFTSLLHAQLGAPQQADKLKQKDVIIADLCQETDSIIANLLTESGKVITQIQTENARLLDTISNLKAEIDTQKHQLTESKNLQKRMVEEMSKTDDDTLQAYGDDCIAWLRSGIKTASPDEITRFTGISKRKVINAIERGNLQTSPRNKELVLVSSLVSWLKNTPAPTGRTEEMPALHIVNG